MPTESGNLATESMVPLIPCPENWMNATALPDWVISVLAVIL